MSVILIIGAGAAGLLCAAELSAAGEKVILLEAQPHAGGRMLTLQPPGFTGAIETGAEFIHGDLPVTLELLKAAGIGREKAGGKMMQVSGGKIIKGDSEDDHWDDMLNRMGKLETDMPLDDFLNTYFGGPAFESLRFSAQRFARGFDLADTSRVSTKALYKEWIQEDGPQYRVAGGYGKLLAYLLQQCRQHGAALHFNTVAHTIQWQPGRVVVHTTGGQQWEGDKLIVTVPLPLLQQTALPGTVHFEPALTGYHDAARAIGFGSVTKYLLQFSEAFWLRLSNKPGFFMTGKNVPTWWTQGDAANPLLTGWLGDQNASHQPGASPESLLDGALQSLAEAFALPETQLREWLTAWHITDWHTHAFAAGAYSYDYPQSAAARKLLDTPVAGTLYFAGEALYQGDVPGTVEAAFESARITIKQCQLSAI